MSSKALIHQVKLNEWASLLADQKASGLTVEDWCLQNNVSKDQYFYWKRQLKDELVTKALPEIVPLALPAAPDPEPQLPTAKDSNGKSCTSCSTFPTASCARVYINGMTVEFDSAASDTLIKSVLKAVRHV